jgi:hypothetical protein
MIYAATALHNLILQDKQENDTCTEEKNSTTLGEVEKELDMASL